MDYMQTISKNFVQLGSQLPTRCDTYESRLYRKDSWSMHTYCTRNTQNGYDGLKFIFCNAEVHEDIALVYGNRMAAECSLTSFVIIILTVSLFCIALF